METTATPEVPLLQAAPAVTDPAGAFTQMLTDKSLEHPQLIESDWEEALRLLITDRRCAPDERWLMSDGR